MAVVSPHIHELWRGFRFSPRALRRPADLWPKRARFSIRCMLFQTNTQTLGTSGGLFWVSAAQCFYMHMQRVTHLRSFRCVFIINTCSAEGLWCSIFVICAHIILVHTLTPLTLSNQLVLCIRSLHYNNSIPKDVFNIRGSFPLHWSFFKEEKSSLYY